MGFKLQDGGGADLQIGSRVAICTDDHDRGRVTRVAPPEDERTYAEITVRFDDGVEDTFAALSTASWYTETDAPYRCDDLMLVT